MDTPIEKLIKFQENFLDYLFNNIETLYGIENDNEHQPVTIPANFQATCYGLWNSKCTGNDFNWSWWNYGNFNIMYTYDVSYTNGDVNYTSFGEVGRFNKSDWDNITEYGTGLPNADEAYRILHEYISSNDQMYIMSTEDPSLPYEVTYMIDDVYQLPKILFSKNNDSGSVYSKYQAGDGNGNPTGTLYSAQYVNIGFWDFDVNVDSDGYVSATTGLNVIPTTYNWGRFNDAVMVTRTDNQNFINNYITNNGAEHNYTYTYETETGDEVTVYYGDNYIIYKSDDDAEITYNDNYNITKKISDDTGIPLSNPDYKTKKYGPPVDYTDDNFGLSTTGFQSNIGGAANYWLMSLLEINGMISDFNLTAPAGAMISQNIVSCYVNALNHEWQTGKDNIVVHAAGAQNTPYTSTNQYDAIVQYNPHVVVGQYLVPRVTETFYDFAPYTTYELYIPFCGWIGLPDTVAGRNIRVYMDFDVATMSCKARVMVEMKDGSGDTICGEITGTFGAPCPIQVIEGGLYRQSMINSGLQIASGLAMGITGGVLGSGALIANGAMNAVQGLASGYMAGNTNYGQTIGRVGDTSNLCGGHYCYIKITHPVIDEVVESETFGHTVGYPCYMESELSELEGTGFTVCLNPHVHINCTQSEKDEIKQLLEQGVIL